MSVLRLGMLACLLASCYSPDFGDRCDITCAEDGSCPDGMSCVTATNLCRRDDGTQTCEMMPPGVTDRKFRKVSAGDRHACAIDMQGGLVCWGANDHGQVRTDDALFAQPTGINITEPVVETWFDVAAGAQHTCGIGGSGDDRKVYCWGDNIFKQCGDNRDGIDVEAQAVEVDLGVDSGVPVEIDAGDAHTCVVTDSKRLYCWGSSSDGQVGTPSPGGAMVIEVAGANWVHVSAGGQVTCATNDNGAALCWGRNDRGQLGTGSLAVTATEIPQPVAIPAPSVRAISVGSVHSCAMNRESEEDFIYCWGNDLEGAVGNDNINGTIEETPIHPRNLGTLAAWADVESGGAMSCGVREGAVFCWGSRDSTAALGDDCLGCRGAISGPVTNFEVKSTGLEPLTNAFDISVGREFGCALFGDSTEGGVARCWGDNSFGQLGTGETTFVAKATPIAQSGPWIQVKTGLHSACGLKEDGTVWCWGHNRVGQVGHQLTPDKFLPTPVQIVDESDDPLVGAIDIAVGWEHACALLDGSGTNRVRCWGLDVDFALGDPTDTDGFESPALPAGNWQAITAGDDVTCVEDNVSTATRCWGFKPTWGAGTEVEWRTPRTLTGDESLGPTVRLGDDTVCSVTGGGTTLQCNGDGQFGLRGDGAGTPPPNDTPSTVMLNNGAPVDHSGGGPLSNHRCAVLAAGNTMCWGNNNHREVSPTPSGAGDGSYNRGIQVELGGSPFLSEFSSIDVKYRRVVTGQEFSCAIQANSKHVFCWGHNTTQQLTSTGHALKDDTNGQLHEIASDGPGTYTTLAAGARFACGLQEDKQIYCWGDSRRGEAGTVSDRNHFVEVVAEPAGQ